jgi:lysophospholipase L1-like esterase
MNTRILKRIASNLSILGLSLALALIAAEGLLRLFPTLLTEEAQLRMHWREILGQTTSLPHSYIGFLYPPYARRTVERGEVRFTYTTDEHGFRNPSSWPNEAEIVAVGDSMTFGYGVDDEQAWPRLLQKRTGKSVVNLGLIGGAPQQYLRIYETFGVALRPKILILGLLPANDVADAQTFEDWLKAGAQGNYDVWRFFRGKPARKSYPSSCEICLLYKARDSLERSSYLYTLWNEARKSFNSSQGYDGTTMKFPNGARMIFTPAMLDRSTAGARPDQPIFHRVINTIEQTHKLAQAHGTDLLIVLIPSKEEIYLPTVGKPTPQPIEPFLPEFEKLQIPYLDLRPHLQQLARQNEVLYFEVDGHPNAQGYAAIADAVLAHLKANTGTASIKSRDTASD